MKTFFKNTRSGLDHFIRSYLPIYLPASILLSILITGAMNQPDDPNFVPFYITALILFCALPAISKSRHTSTFKHRLKTFFLISGDTFVIAVTLYMLTNIPLSGYSLAIATCVWSAVLFLSISTLLRRGIYIAFDLERETIVKTISFTWRNAPNLLIYMGTGISIAIIALGLVNFLSSLLPIENFKDTYALGFMAFGFVLLPVSFLPFILLTEGLKPTDCDFSSD
jgi:hypothetical protein